jgi:hypothetical protein
MPDISEMLVSDSPYSSAKELQPINETATIDEVGTDVYEGNPPFIWIKPDCLEKPVRLNKTNARGLAGQFGNDTDAWVGKKITLMTVPSQTPDGTATFGWMTIPVTGKKGQGKAKPATVPVNATPDDDIPF